MSTILNESLAAELRAPSRANNFDFLRLASAILVIFSHAFPLVTGRQDAEFLSRWSRDQLSLGGVAVSIFFLISGYLITQSWERCRDARDYFRRRVCRIYPGFLVAFLLSAVVVLPLSSSKPSACFTPVEITGMTVQGIFLNDLGAESAFVSNPYPHAVNGSLWTIRHEFWCYVIVAFLGVVGLLKSRRFVLLAFAATWALLLVMSVHHLGSPWPPPLRTILGIWSQWPGLLVYFLAGSVAYRFRDGIRYTNRVALLAAFALGTTLIVRQGFYLVWPLGLSYLTFWFAFHDKIRLHDVVKHVGGDYSYGIYLYAFPIQQLLVLYSHNRLPVLAHFAAATVLTGAAGILSWHLVEKHFMKRARRSPPKAIHHGGAENTEALAPS